MPDPTQPDPHPIPPELPLPGTDPDAEPEFAPPGPVDPVPPATPLPGDIPGPIRA